MQLCDLLSTKWFRIVRVKQIFVKNDLSKLQSISNLLPETHFNAKDLSTFLCQICVYTDTKERKILNKYTLSDNQYIFRSAHYLKYVIIF